MHVVAVTPQRTVLVCRSAQGERFLPGGTREPGESPTDLVRRELLEEAGAVPTGPLLPFSAHQAVSHSDGPHRSHLPHPAPIGSTR